MFPDPLPAVFEIKPVDSFLIRLNGVLPILEMHTPGLILWPADEAAALGSCPGLGCEHAALHGLWEALRLCCSRDAHSNPPTDVLLRPRSERQGHCPRTQADPTISKFNLNLFFFLWGNGCSLHSFPCHLQGRYNPLVSFPSPLPAGEGMCSIGQGVGTRKDRVETAVLCSWMYFFALEEKEGNGKTVFAHL